jgi:elongation factor P--(R)-beta-lysine ligase
MTSRWFDPQRHADRRPFLRARGTIRAALRGWFEARGFVEAECGILQLSPGNETHLHGFATRRLWPDGAQQPLYLHTSPEFAAKKLLAAGETALFDFARVFRNREIDSPLHAAEFTMLEWYRAHADWQVVIEDTLALARAAAAAVGAPVWHWRGVEVSAQAPVEHLSLAEAFERHAGIDLLATLGPAGEPLREALAAQVAAAGLRAAPDDSWSDLFTKVLVARIEPHLGRTAPTILHSYPAPEAALARRSASDPRVAERFELYVCGVELANGFGELTDPAEQSARFEADMDEKERLYGERYPIDPELLEALARMPPASGVALGFDRLVMLCTGARSVHDVIWTPA